MEFDFDKSMQQTSDEELIRIVTVHRHQYEPAALLAADNEFKKRGLVPETLDELKDEDEEAQELADAKANLPLEPVMKVIAFLFAGALFWFVGGSFVKDGYLRKANEFRKWALLGLLLYVILVLIFIRQ